MNIQDWFPLGLTGFISLQSKTRKILLQHHSSKASILWCSAFLMVHLSHLYMTTGKTIGLTIWTFVSKVISLLINILSRLSIAFLPKTRPKNAKECSTFCTVGLISHASKVMLKILQARLQQYINQELSDEQYNIYLCKKQTVFQNIWTILHFYQQ